MDNARLGDYHLMTSLDFFPNLSNIFFIRYLDVLFQPRISLSLSFLINFL